MKLCMIGCGEFARRFHGPAQRRCATEERDLELVACCDTDATRAREYAGQFGFARHSTDMLTMLKAERPDAIVLAVPPAITCDVASRVLAHGIPLLLEKPPGISPAELARLIEAAERGHAPAQVAFNRRHMPVLAWARRTLDTAFAEAPATRIDYEMIRFDRWDRDFSTTAVHAIDAVRFLAGPFRTATIDYHVQNAAGREAVNILLRLDCASGARVQVTIQPVAGFNAEFAKVHGVGQTLVIRVPYPEETAADGAVEHWRGSTLVGSFSDAGRDVVEKMGIVDETRAFLGAVRSGTGFSPRLEDCRQQVELMEAIRLRRTGPIEFPAP